MERRAKRQRRSEREAIAKWRYEQIELALPVLLSRQQRALIVRQIAAKPVVWPSGETKPVPRATAYRWMDLYENCGGLKALEPKVRSDRGTKRAPLPEEVVEKALQLLSNDPEMGFTFLIAQLECDPGLKLEERRIKVSRSTLQRRLAERAIYIQMVKARSRARKYVRYVARHAHDIWRLDAKGPVEVRLSSRKVIKIHILTILDDATRAVLAVLVAHTPDLASAVRVFRVAVKRWGLPRRFYADRASIFDSKAFRSGLADLGVHRCYVRGRNPAGNGKIEAYHRSLRRWFTARLSKQEVIDLEHIQQLLEAMIAVIYQNHLHRELKKSPKQALDERISKRTISSQRLDECFKEWRKKRSHPKTGEIDLPTGKYIVPEELRGQRLRFVLDPDPQIEPLVEDPQTNHLHSLTRAEVVSPEVESPERWGSGPLQVLYDAWQKQVRPIADPGFGIGEIMSILSKISGRTVPRSDEEAREIHRLYQKIGPLPGESTQRTLESIGSALGAGRPMSVYLAALEERVAKANSASQEEEK
jgi:transposase InsO family protein